jgi:hypothetical protein
MPQIKRVGAGGGGFRRSKSAEFLRTVTLRTRYSSVSAKLTKEEISYLADIVTADDEAPAGLLEKLVLMEDKFSQIMKYEDLITAATGRKT